MSFLIFWDASRFSRLIGVPGACFLAASIFGYSGANHSSPALLSGRPFGENSSLWHNLWFLKVFLKIKRLLYSIFHAVDFMFSLCFSKLNSTSLSFLGRFQMLSAKPKILKLINSWNLRFVIFGGASHFSRSIESRAHVFWPPWFSNTVVRSTLLQLCSLGALSGKIQAYDIICGFSKFSWKSTCVCFNLSCCGFLVFSLPFNAQVYLLILSRALSKAFR